jgi:hypothetical protein
VTASNEVTCAGALASSGRQPRTHITAHGLFRRTHTGTRYHSILRVGFWSGLGKWWVGVWWALELLAATQGLVAAIPSGYGTSHVCSCMLCTLEQVRAQLPEAQLLPRPC